MKLDSPEFQSWLLAQMRDSYLPALLAEYRDRADGKVNEMIRKDGACDRLKGEITGLELAISIPTTLYADALKNKE